MQSHYANLNGRRIPLADDVFCSPTPLQTHRPSLFRLFITLLLWLAAAQLHAVTADDLATKIFSNLSKNLPAIDATALRNRSYDIAVTALATPAPTDYTTLETGLENAFQSPNFAILNWVGNKDKLKQAASQIASDCYPNQLRTAEEMHINASLGNSSNVWGHLTLWTGAKFSNPYSINSNHILGPAGNSSDGYIEINLSSRFVERSGDKAQDAHLTGDSWFTSAIDTPKDKVFFTKPWAHMPDFDTRLGYLFRGSKSPSNFDSSTIAGSADFYNETSMGLPFVRYLSDSWKWQLTLPELGGGFATDKNVLTLHPSFFAGLGFQTGYLGINSTNWGYWYGRAGLAFIDEPELSKGTNTVVFDHLGEPKFNLKCVPSVGVIVTYPLTSTLSFQTGANAYFTSHPPSSWNATLGISLDIDKFFSAVIGK